MIYTDYIFVISDNPEDDFKELHDFMKSQKHEKKYSYRSPFVPYYYVYKKNRRRWLKNTKALYMPKKAIMNYINNGILSDIPVRRNYTMLQSSGTMNYIYWKFCQQHNLPHKRRYALQYTCKSNAQIYGWVGSQKVSIHVSDKYPNGIGYIETDGVITEHPIPLECHAKLEKFTRFLTQDKAYKQKKFRKKLSLSND